MRYPNVIYPLFKVLSFLFLFKKSMHKAGMVLDVLFTIFYPSVYSILDARDAGVVYKRNIKL